MLAARSAVTTQPIRLCALLCVISDQKKHTVQMAVELPRFSVHVVLSSPANAFSSKLATLSQGQSPQAVNLYVFLQRVSGNGLISTKNVSKVM